MVVVFACVDSVTVVSVQTDQGENLALAVGPEDDTANTYVGFVYYKAGVAPGTRKITITLSAAVQYVHVSMYELTKIRTTSTIVGSNHGHGSSTSLVPGSFTPSENDCFIFHTAWNDFGTDTTSFAAQAGAELICADLDDGMVAQCFIQSTAAAINPVITMAPSNTFLSLACAFKRDVTQGTPLPTTVPRIRGVQWWNCHQRGGTTRIEQFPCVGGNVVGMWIGFKTGGGPDAFTAITDSLGNGYAITEARFVPTGGGPQALYSLNMRPSSSLTITLTHDETLTDSTLLLYDVQAPKEHVLALAGMQLANGNQVVLGDVSTVSITPTVLNTIVFGSMGVASGTINGVVGSDYVSDTPYSPVEGETSPTNLHEDNGWAHLFDCDGSTKTFVWTYQGSTASSGVGPWAAQALAFQVLGPQTPLKAVSMQHRRG